MARGSAKSVWFCLWVAGVAAAATSLVATALPTWLALAGALVLTVVYSSGLTHRCGGRVWLWTVLTSAAAAATYVADERWAWSALSVLTAVAGATLAVMLTRPAASALATIMEFVLSVVMASSVAVAVAAINAPVNSGRFNLVVLGLSLACALAVVWQLGAGLHGIGRRGFVMILGAALGVTIVLVYGTFLREYGSQSLIGGINESVTWMQDHIGGVPRPVEVLVGFPALVWGVNTRSSRRQGWWMCAFGALGTATIATSLASPKVDPVYALISTGYSVVLGVALGLAVRRLDQVLTSTGSRALRSGDQDALRPEPERTLPLR